MLKKTVLFSFLFSLPFSFLLAGENIPNVKMGYHDGFYVQTEDGRYSLKVGTRFNFGYTHGFLEEENNLSSFDLMHAKFYAGGNVFFPSLQYFFQFEAGTHTRDQKWGLSETEQGSLTLEDFFVRLGPRKNFLKLGQLKVPLGRQWMTNSGNLQFTQRSEVSQSFSLGRDRGVLLGGERDTFSYSLGVFNGGGTILLGRLASEQRISEGGQNHSNDFQGKGLLWVARFVVSPNGEVGYSEGDIEQSEGFRWELNAGASWDQGRDINFALDGAIDDYDVDILTLNGGFAWKHHGTSFLGEFFYRHANGSRIETFDSMGFYVQPSFLFLSNFIELAARLGWFDSDQNISHDHLWEVAGVTNVYLSHSHQYKVQFQYTWKAEESHLGGKREDHFMDVMFQISL